MNRAILWKGLSLTAFSLLLTNTTWAQSCDLVVNGSSQTGDTLSLDIHSSKANINPYKVTIIQNGKVHSSWDSIPHASGEKLKIPRITASGAATVRIQSTKVPACETEAKVTLSPDISQPPSAGGCDLAILSHSQSGSTMYFDLYSSKANINPYNVKIMQGSKEIGTWPNVAHARGGLLAVPGIKGSGEATVTITSSKMAVCSDQRVVILEQQSSSQKETCKQGPELKNISNITNNSLIAQFHGQDVEGIDYIIKSSSGSIVHTGSIVPTNSTPGITYPTLGKGKYFLTFRGNTCVGESTKDFTITSGQTVAEGEIGSTTGSNSGGESGLKACAAGPELRKISNVSSSSLSAEFHGIDVKGIEYKILDSTGSQVAGGQIAPINNTPVVTYPALGAGAYTLAFIGSSCIGHSQMSFNISGVVTPKPSTTGGSTPSGAAGGTSGGSAGGGLTACAAGPEILEVNSVTQTSLVARFHGQGITGMDYSILNSSGGEVYVGKVSPKSATPTFAYPTLKAGNYTLKIAGNNCDGEHSRAFVIPEANSNTAGGSNNGSANGSNGSSGNSSSGSNAGGPSSAQCSTSNTANFTEQLTFGCNENQRVTKTLMYIDTGSEVWSDGGKNRTNRGFNPLRIPPAGAKLLDLPSMRFAMDEWEKLGGTSIAIHLQWAATEPKPGHYVWEVLDWVLDYAACKKMKLVLKLDTDGQGARHAWDIDTTPDDCSDEERNSGICKAPGSGRAHRYMEADEMRMAYERKDDRPGYGGMTTLTNDRTLSFSSDKWNTNVNRWVNAVAERVAARNRKDTVLYAMMTSTANQEFEYPHGGDHSPMEKQAWHEWQRRKFGVVKYENTGNGISSNGMGKDWFIFRTERLKHVYSYLNRAFQSRGMKTVYDTGSFLDADGNRNTWGIPFAANEFGVDGLKHNPALNYPHNIYTKTLACTGKWATVEWTYVPEQGVNVDNITPAIAGSIDNGTNDISFAFLTATQVGDRFEMRPELIQIVNKLKASGHWDRKQQCFTGGKKLDITLSDVLNNTGAHHKNRELDSLINENGRRGVCTNLIDDIGLKEGIK